MAKCEKCGKAVTFGHNRSFSKRATRRSYRPNLQKVAVWSGKRKQTMVLCARCLRSSVKVK
ncbi:MAG: 50S ribosomal protein L28 [Anaerolineales bacterium]|nr:50S ribosomal protein L28 [Anaerolineales bacterium]